MTTEHTLIYCIIHGPILTFFDPQRRHVASMGPSFIPLGAMMGVKKNLKFYEILRNLGIHNVAILTNFSISGQFQGRSNI